MQHQGGGANKKNGASSLYLDVTAGFISQAGT